MPVAVGRQEPWTPSPAYTAWVAAGMPMTPSPGASAAVEGAKLKGWSLGGAARAVGRFLADFTGIDPVRHLREGAAWMQGRTAEAYAKSVPGVSFIGRYDDRPGLPQGYGKLRFAADIAEGANKFLPYLLLVMGPEAGMLEATGGRAGSVAAKAGVGPLRSWIGKTVSKGATTPAGRPLSTHYLLDTGPVRNIPGSVVDEAIDRGFVSKDLADRAVYYHPENDVTVVLSKTTGKIMSARRGKP